MIGMQKLWLGGHWCFVDSCHSWFAWQHTFHALRQRWQCCAMGTQHGRSSIWKFVQVECGATLCLGPTGVLKLQLQNLIAQMPKSGNLVACGLQNFGGI